MIIAVLENELDNVDFVKDAVFGLKIPVECNGVPSEILNPRNTWDDQKAYDDKANNLASQFILNFRDFELFANEETMNGGPVLNSTKN
jgi:phosphoenolpyruvate carboxykinase (ATP)